MSPASAFSSAKRASSGKMFKNGNISAKISLAIVVAITLLACLVTFCASSTTTYITTSGSYAGT